jgi:hypothetical protein
LLPAYSLHKFSSNFTGIIIAQTHTPLQTKKRLFPTFFVLIRAVTFSLVQNDGFFPHFLHFCIYPAVIYINLPFKSLSEPVILSSGALYTDYTKFLPCFYKNFVEIILTFIEFWFIIKWKIGDG